LAEIFRPDSPHLVFARSLFELREFDQALECLELTPPQNRTAEDYLLRGVCMVRLRKFPEATIEFENLLQLDANHFEALTWLALLNRNRKEIGDALTYANRAVELRPLDATAHGALGACHLYLRNASLALASFGRAVELDPNSAEHEHNLGLAYEMAHANGNAITHFRKAIALAPKNHQSYLTLANAYLLYGMAGEALDCLSEGVTAVPKAPGLHSALGAAFTSIRNDLAAEHHYRIAAQLSPGAQGAYASFLVNQGKFEQANEIFDRMIRDEIDPAAGYYGIMQSRKLTQADADFVLRMESVLGSGKLASGSEMYMHYALGRAKDQLKLFEGAMRHFDEANGLAFRIHHSGCPVNPSEFRTENEKVERLYEKIANLSIEGSPSGAPIFIVGMIRSGTTLLDQIISSHSEVASGGELRYWIEETLRLALKTDTPTAQDLREIADQYFRYVQLLVGSSPHFTDKMPLNFAYIGVIHTAVPNARFIHIRRNPVDTCLSIYTTYFGKGALFAYDKHNIVSYYREYLRMLEYWRDRIPKDRLLEIDYENLISNPGTVIPEVIRFCSLNWEDACLHHDKNETTINTPSRWQARQPVYKTSLERWRNYEPWLGEFASLQGP
jgi:tetratricopeptide (TPR) repeat protein